MKKIAIIGLIFLVSIVNGAELELSGSVVSDNQKNDDK